jgi:hypothetical protein
MAIISDISAIGSAVFVAGFSVWMLIQLFKKGD